LGGSLLAVALVAGGCSLAGSSDDSDDRTDPAAAPSVVTLPSTAPPARGHLQPGPVLLVHGYGGTSAALSQLATEIRSLGRTAVIVDPVGDNTGDINDQIAGLERAVSDAEKAGAPSVDVIGYSAGGVVALAWSKRHDGEKRARRIISLGSPFHGTQIAATAVATAPELCPTACRQLAPGSELLRELDVDGAGAEHPAWLALWTRFDTVVTPPESANLKGAVTLPVQQVCPEVRVGHTDLPADPVIRRMVRTALSDAPLAAPDASACG
jgi:triacylglycerol esterase/lipase EstA (alpha/beta hydrolase family)